MIIRQLTASNFLKYQDVSLNNLPERGIVGIVGTNESGKTTLGEAICFALFGRTSVYAKDRLTRLVRWGARRCEVTLEVVIEQKKYVLDRFIDDEGYFGAVLKTFDGAEETETLEGFDEVTTAIERLLGFGFDEYLESFYLIQQEISTPRADSRSVKKMSGIDTLEKVLNGFEQDISSENEVIAGLEQEKNDLQTMLDETDSNLARIEKMSAEKEKVIGELERIDNKRIWLNENIKAVPEAQKQLRQSVASLGESGVDVSYLDWMESFTDITSSVTDLEASLPESESGTEPVTGNFRGRLVDIESMLIGFEDLVEALGPRRAKLAEILEENFISMTAPSAAEKSGAGMLKKERQLFDELAKVRQKRWLALAGCGSGLVFYLILLLFFNLFANSGTGIVMTLLFTVICGGLATYFYRYQTTELRQQQELDSYREQLREARKAARALDEIMTSPLPQALEVLQNDKDESVANRAVLFSEGPGYDLLDAQRFRSVTHDLERQLDLLFDQVEPLVAKLQAEQERLGKEKLFYLGERDEITARLAEVEARIRPAIEIEMDIETCQSELVRCQDRLALLEYSRDLVKGACEHVAYRFSQDLRLIISRILPCLTDERYGSIKVDSDLSVKVFANEKQDFVDFDEISSGTQRQIRLAVRLALSEQMVQAAGLGVQSLFLDEPFAFFDAARTRKTLEMLPNLSHGLAQILVVGQEFESIDLFDRVITCDADSKSLAG